MLVGFKKKWQYDNQRFIIINHILNQAKTRIDEYKKFVTNKEKARYIDEIAKQIDKK